MRRAFPVLGLAVAACAGSRPPHALGPEEITTTLPRPAGDPEAPLAGFAIWQGWSMRWGYNHRLNRAGGLVEQEPCTDADLRAGRPCRARLTLAAASGSGPDRADVENYVALVVARGIQAVSAAREFVLRGAEGEPLSVGGDVAIPLHAAWRDTERLIPILSGFDAGSLSSADKLKRLSVRLGEPRIEAGAVLVPVTIDATLACSSGECPPLDRVDMSFLIGVTVLGGAPRALEARPVGAESAYAWEKKEEVPASATTKPLPRSADDGLLALRAFEVELSDELHLLQLGLAVPPDDSVLHTNLRNWSAGMRNSRRPYSFFAYSEEGSATWRVELWELAFRDASVSRRSWSTVVDWKPKGRHAFDPLAEQTRMLLWTVAP
jgi:hypothetical protein